jgi:hypothetical protein
VIHKCILGFNASSVLVSVMLPLNCANKALVFDGKEYVSEEEGIEKLIYEPNPDEFGDLDDDCSSDPNHPPFPLAPLTP